MKTSDHHEIEILREQVQDYERLLNVLQAIGSSLKERRTMASLNRHSRILTRLEIHPESESAKGWRDNPFCCA
jgi:hypothetical protein